MLCRKRQLSTTAVGKAESETQNHGQDERMRGQRQQESVRGESSNHQQRAQGYRQEPRYENTSRDRGPEEGAEQPRAPRSPAMKKYLREDDRWREFLVQDPDRAENMDRSFREWTKKCRDILHQDRR